MIWEDKQDKKYPSLFQITVISYVSRQQAKKVELKLYVHIKVKVTPTTGRKGPRVFRVGYDPGFS
jgi:hypothetical protein